MNCTINVHCIVAVHCTVAEPCTVAVLMLNCAVHSVTPPWLFLEGSNNFEAQREKFALPSCLRGQNSFARFSPKIENKKV